MCISHEISKNLDGASTPPISGVVHITVVGRQRVEMGRDGYRRLISADDLPSQAGNNVASSRRITQPWKHIDNIISCPTATV